MSNTPKPLPDDLHTHSKHSKFRWPTIPTIGRRVFVELPDKVYVSSEGGVSINLDDKVVELGLKRVKEKYNIGE